MSHWVREEVDCTILPHRMAEQHPALFTSNLGYDELENHLTYTQRGDKDVVKARRIMERIQMVSTDIKLSGDNRRKK